MKGIITICYAIHGAGLLRQLRDRVRSALMLQYSSSTLGYKPNLCIPKGDRDGVDDVADPERVLAGVVTVGAGDPGRRAGAAVAGHGGLHLQATRATVVQPEEAASPAEVQVRRDLEGWCIMDHGVKEKLQGFVALSVLGNFFLEKSLHKLSLVKISQGSSLI